MQEYGKWQGKNPPVFPPASGTRPGKAAEIRNSCALLRMAPGGGSRLSSQEMKASPDDRSAGETCAGCFYFLEGHGCCNAASRFFRGTQQRLACEAFKQKPAAGVCSRDPLHPERILRG